MDFKSGDEEIVFIGECQRFSNKDEIWDDNAVIKMYDQCIQRTYEKVEEDGLSASTGSKRKQKKWHVGDLCLAPYYEDNLWYPAVIEEVSSDTCKVLYEEYNETAQVKLVELEPREEESETSEDIDPSKSAKHGKAKTQRCNTGNGETASGFPSGSKTAKDFGVDSVKCCFPPLEMPTSVPPPPPMFSGIPPPNDEEAFSNMLLSWYMCGYHTGYCQAIQNERKKKMDTCKDLPPS
ncbi:unnamed protein product [Enterobius vermicularis]|uniref:Tudor domain-containing protein n=1 Tax=Enterobius vermicularis TaxID=51028 RepID=A0A0N4VDH3_ENTVE|nr:unnamed protein product [Enterobius vermicularis]